MSNFTDTSLKLSEAETRPQKGRNLAIAEWITDSAICKYGAVDYALFVGLTLVGVIEAKSIHDEIYNINNLDDKDIEKETKIHVATVQSMIKRILFEQMLGRATRLCHAINKTHFEIYDAVGVYDSLAPVNTMKPVVQDEFATFVDLLNGLDVMKTDEQVKNQIDLIIAKIHRKKRNMSEQDMEHFVDISGGIDPTQQGLR